MLIIFYCKFILGNYYYYLDYSSIYGSFFYFIYLSLASSNLLYVSTSLNLRLMCFSVISFLSLIFIDNWINNITYEFLLFFQVWEYFFVFLQTWHINPNYYTSHFLFSLLIFLTWRFHNLSTLCKELKHFQMHFLVFVQLILLLAWFAIFILHLLLKM